MDRAASSVNRGTSPTRQRTQHPNRSVVPRTDAASRDREGHRRKGRDPKPRWPNFRHFFAFSPPCVRFPAPCYWYYVKLRLVSDFPSIGVRDERMVRTSSAQDPLVELVPLALRGDVKAERTLLVAVGPSMVAIVRRVIGAHHPDVEDLCQESFLALLSALPSFRGQCTVLHFACRVSLYTSLAARRRIRFQAERVTDSAEQHDEIPSDHEPSPAELAEQREIRQALRELLDALPMHQSEVLALHILLGHTVEEIASMTECGINTIRSRLRRGLESMREVLANRGDLQVLLRGAHE